MELKKLRERETQTDRQTGREGERGRQQLNERMRFAVCTKRWLCEKPSFGNTIKGDNFAISRHRTLLKDSDFV